MLRIWGICVHRTTLKGVVFLREVWPLVRRERADARMLLAGSSPAQAIEDAVGNSEGVLLHPNPPDVVPVLRDARVLVNPIFWREWREREIGGDAVCAGASGVVTPGVAGLPEMVSRCFAVEADAHAFARAVLQAISDGGLQGAELLVRQAARAQFDFERVGDVLRLIADRCAKFGQQELPAR